MVIKPEWNKLQFNVNLKIAEDKNHARFYTITPSKIMPIYQSINSLSGMVW